MRRIAAAGGVAVVALAAGVIAVRMFGESNGEPRAPRAREGRSTDVRALRVGGATVAVELAQTSAEWARGLSNRDTLSAGAGMLFVFPFPELRVFWMWETSIPLDLVWMHRGRVVGVTENVQPEPGVPEEQLRRYRSPAPVDQVLEVNAGWSARSGVRAGDPVVLF